MKLKRTLSFTAITFCTLQTVAAQTTLHEVFAKIGGERDKAAILVSIEKLEDGLKRTPNTAPEVPRALIELCHLYNRTGENRKALNAVDACLQLKTAKPNVALTALHDKATILRELGSTKEAIACYKLVLNYPVNSTLKRALNSEASAWVDHLTLSTIDDDTTRNRLILRSVREKLLTKNSPSEGSIAEARTLLERVSPSAKVKILDIYEEFLRKHPNYPNAAIIALDELKLAEPKEVQNYEPSRLEQILLKYPKESESRSHVEYALALTYIHASEETKAKDVFEKVLAEPIHKESPFYEPWRRSAVMRMVMQSYDILGDKENRDAMSKKIQVEYPGREDARYAATLDSKWRSEAQVNDNATSVARYVKLIMAAVLFLATLLGTSAYVIRRQKLKHK